MTMLFDTARMPVASDAVCGRRVQLWTEDGWGKVGTAHRYEPDVLWVTWDGGGDGYVRPTEVRMFPLDPGRLLPMALCEVTVPC